jgi:hypothetical protein
MKIIMTLLFVFLSCICFSPYITGQTRSIVISDLTTIDSLRNIYSSKKEIPSIYETPVYLAISYFPELESSKIVFRKARIRTTLNARPAITSIFFRKKSKRKYIIRINTTMKDSVILLDSIPLNAMIGLFGHEFSHLIDYNTKNIFGVFSRLIAYSSDKSKEKFEKEIDLITIKRGLGWQLYDWSYYVLNKSSGTEKYKNYKRQIYLEPKEIKEIIISSKKS